MKITAVIIGILLMIDCKGQANNTATPKQDTITVKNSNKMNRPKIDSNFEKLNLEDFKDKLELKKDKHYDGSIDEYYKYENITDSGAVKLDGGPKGLVGYIYTPKNSIYKILKNYYGSSLIIQSKRIFINDDRINPSPVVGKEYQYNEQGHLIKTIDHDDGYDFSFEQAYEFVKSNFNDEKKIKEGLKYMYEFYGKTSSKGQKYWEIKFHIGHFPASYIETVLKLDAKTGKILSHKEYLYEIEKEVKLHKIIVPDQTKGETGKSVSQSTIYKTYQGKDYTQGEWKVFEQEQYNEHLRKTGRADLVEPTDDLPTPRTKNSFLADENDVKPKPKKGFWG